MTNSILHHELAVRRAEQRGHADHGWLKSAHTFSFADYHDPAVMGYRSLRVINEDRVAPGAGFDRHPHRDMEIISYVLEGALRHVDGMGSESILHAGEFQLMSAGRGIEHAEFNASRDEPVEFYQIWIQPESRGLVPSYEELRPDITGPLTPIASRDGRENSMTLHQDANLWLGRPTPDAPLTVEVAPGRGIWIQVTRESVRIGDTTLHAGDGASIDAPATLDIVGGRSGAEFLLFDLA